MITVAKISVSTGKVTHLQDGIPNFRQAELIAQHQMNLKNHLDELVVIFPGMNRGVTEGHPEYERAVLLSENYACINGRLNK
jgi:hypothetical protein